MCMMRIDNIKESDQLVKIVRAVAAKRKPLGTTSCYKCAQVDRARENADPAETR